MLQIAKNIVHIRRGGTAADPPQFAIASVAIRRPAQTGQAILIIEGCTNAVGKRAVAIGIIFKMPGNCAVLRHTGELVVCIVAVAVGADLAAHCNALINQVANLIACVSLFIQHNATVFGNNSSRLPEAVVALCRGDLPKCAACNQTIASVTRQREASGGSE